MPLIGALAPPRRWLASFLCAAGLRAAAGLLAASVLALPALAEEDKVILQNRVAPGDGEVQPEVALLREPGAGGRVVVVTGSGLLGWWSVDLRCGGATWTLFRTAIEGSAEEATATFRVPADVGEAARAQGRCRLHVLDKTVAIADATAAAEWAGPDRDVRRPAALVGRVMWVLDGQTIGVQLGDRVETVRYAGIVVHERPPGRGLNLGEQGPLVVNRDLVVERPVRLELDEAPRDHLGRMVAYVYVDDVMVNAELVRRGYAETSAVGPNLRHRETFARLEADARRDRRGFWAPGEAPSIAGDVEKTATPLDDHTCPRSHPIKARTFPAVGQKFFYPVGSVLLERVPTEVCYAREIDAMVDGYTRSRR